MPNDTRFIPITVSLDGNQAEASFQQLGDRITAVAKRASQEIISASNDVYARIIANNEAAFAQYSETQLRMIDATKQTVEIQERMTDKVSEIAESVNRLSEGFGHLSEKIGESGEKSESFLAKYHEGAASILYTIEIIGKFRESLDHSGNALSKFGDTAVKGFDKLKDIKFGWPKEAFDRFSERLSNLPLLAIRAKDKIATAFSGIGDAARRGLMAPLEPISNFMGVFSKSSAAETKAISDTTALKASMEALTPAVQANNQATTALMSAKAADTAITAAETGAVSGLAAAMGTLELVAGGIGLVLGLIGLLYSGYTALTASSKETAQITEDSTKQFVEEASALRELKTTVDAIGGSQINSAEAHKQLETILTRLNPTTRDYINTVLNEKDAVDKLGPSIDKALSATMPLVEARMVTLSHSIIENMQALQEANVRYNQAMDKVANAKAMIRSVGNEPDWYLTQVMNSASEALIKAGEDVDRTAGTVRGLTGDLKRLAEVHQFDEKAFINFSLRTSATKETIVDLNNAYHGTITVATRMPSILEQGTGAIDKQAKAVWGLTRRLYELADGEVSARVQKKINQTVDNAVGSNGNVDIAQVRKKLREDSKFMDDVKRQNSYNRAVNAVNSSFLSSGGGYGSGGRSSKYDPLESLKEDDANLKLRLEDEKNITQLAKEEAKIKRKILEELKFHHKEKELVGNETIDQLIDLEEKIHKGYKDLADSVRNSAKDLDPAPKPQVKRELPPDFKLDLSLSALAPPSNLKMDIPQGVPVSEIGPAQQYYEVQKQLNDQLQQGLHLTQTQTLERRIQNREFGIISEQQEKELLNLSRSVEEQQKFLEKTQKIKETLVNAFEQGLQHGPKAFFKSLFDSFKQTILKMESEWAASKVMQFLFPTKPGTSGASPGTGAGNPGEKAHPIQSVINHAQNLANQSASESSSGPAHSEIPHASAVNRIPAVTNLLKRVPLINKLFNHGSKAAVDSAAGTAGSLANKALSAAKSGAGAAASSGGILSKLGMAGMFSNPFSAAAAIAPIALPLIMELFGGGVEKAIKNEVKKDYNVDIKDSKILQQIKSIGDQTYGKQLSSHIPQLVAMDQVKQIVTQYGMYADPNFFNTKLGQTKHLTDIDANANQFTRRATGGPVAANMPYLVGEKRPELFIPRVDGAIHPDPIGDMTRRVLDGARSKMSTQTGNQGHSTNGLAYAIQSLVEQVSRLTAISPGQVLQTGAQQNPTAISGGLIEGLRQNFGHRRELNGITGA